MRIWRRRPKDVPRKARGNAAWEQAYRDLYAAREWEDLWAGMLRDPRAEILFTPAECVEKVFQAREAEIDALWRLGWDKDAERKAADLAMRKTWRARPHPVGYGTGPHVDPNSGRYGPQA